MYEVGALPRPALPADLEGRVVAALQAGHRQARAAQAVAELGRVSSPQALDQAVDAEFEETVELELAELELDGASVDAPEGADDGLARLPVPGVLDRLVAEELAAPSQARARRYLGSLRRRHAPEELRMRVGLILADLLYAIVDPRIALAGGIAGRRP